MIVSRKEFPEIVKRLSRAGTYGADTETTGLTEADELFSVILADADDAYYFSFNERPDHLGNMVPEEYRLPRGWIAQLAPIFEQKNSLLGLTNAKFDMKMLAKEGVQVLAAVHDTEVGERMVQNNYLGHKPYSLGSQAKRRGLKKDDRLDDYIKEHGLIEKVEIPGKAKLHELKKFYLVPFPIVTEYAQQDAKLSRIIMLDQCVQLQKLELMTPQAPKLMPILDNERKLTKVCFRMERAGIKISRDYTKQAMAHAQGEALNRRKEFVTLVGREFEDSPDVLAEVFTAAGIVLPKTPKSGKICTNKTVLDALDNPIADKIREIRTVEKLISTYYSSFLHFADACDMIHPNMRQGGTETTRFSYSDPNLQNVPKEDDEEDRLKPFLVRKCFIPHSPDYFFAPVDFKQQEFKMMADYAGAHGIIAACNEGEDFHDVVAKMMGISRKQAKTINFGLLYGMGVDKLARDLKVSYDEAARLKAAYFARFPEIKKFIEGVRAVGKARGFVWNWHGSRCNISSPDFAYILPNHVIQGGCAQVLRLAMVQIDDYIRAKKLRSFMTLQVHDELLFSVHKNEVAEVNKFREIMEAAYRPRNGIKLDCSMEHSWKSWGKWDQVKGLPA